MNKTELITLLRDPSAISSSHLEEIEKLVEENPYFLSARLLLAKGSKELKQPSAKKRVASAAVYSTDRILLKKYITGDLFFLSQPPKIEKPVRRKVVTKEETVQAPDTNTAKEKEEKASRMDKRPSALKPKSKKPSPKVPNVPTGDLDAILEELKQDMENLKSSRAHFVEVQDKINEDEKPSHADEAETAKEEVVAQEELMLEDLKKDIEKEVIDSESKAPKVQSKKNPPKKKTSAEEEEEIINKKLAELAKKQEEIAAKVERELEIEKQNKAAEEQLEKKEVEAEIDTEPEATEEKEPKSTLKQNSETKTPAEEEKESISQKVEQKAEGKTAEISNNEETPANEDEKVASDKKTTVTKAKRKTKEVEPESESVSGKQSSVKEETESKSKVNESAKEIDKTQTESRSKKEEVDTEQEEGIAREPRFSRSSTRSYLRNLEVPDDAFMDFGKDDDPGEIEEEELRKIAQQFGEDEVPASKEKTIKKEDTLEPEKTPNKEKTKTTPAKKEESKEKSSKSTSKRKETPTSKETDDVAPPKNTIIKKAKLVKRKRSTRQSGGSGKSSEPKLPKSKDDDDGKGDRDQQKKLIEKFIKESPSIKYERDAEKSEQDLAENSTSWDKNLASEYLAEIYIHQGNKKRAIEIYEALSLKYPEKKSYFADLISKIK